MKSIIQEDDSCFLCYSPSQHTHHCIYGRANRNLADKYGLTVRLCWQCHAEVHAHPNTGNDKKLKELAQRRFQEENPGLSFRMIFGRNYL